MHILYFSLYEVNVLASSFFSTTKSLDDPSSYTFR